jgi:hypothetical protein
MSGRTEETNERSRRMAPEPYSFLPEPEAWPLDAPDPPTQGWWNDPLSSYDIYQRYYDGTHWTPYVSGRSARRWTEIFPDQVNTEVDPNALGIPLPPASPDPPPDPPTVGWWADPIERKLKQARYFDGEKWTDLIAPIKSAGPRLVTRRLDPKEVIREQKAPQRIPSPGGPGAAPAKKKRWPWSRQGD